MSECNVLYKKGNKVSIERGLKAYLKNRWTSEMFIEQFRFTGVPLATRYEYNTLDTSDEIQKSLKDFIDDFEEILGKMAYYFPNKLEKIETIRDKVYTELPGQLDKTQVSSYFNETNNESKSITEILDRNTLNLDAHLSEIYGSDSYDIIKTLKEKFSDNITAAAYWDLNSGKVVIRSNIYLNDNIRALKNKYYAKIVEYLKSINKLDESYPPEMFQDGDIMEISYFEVMSIFYNHIKSIENLKDQLNEYQRSVIKETDKKTKEDLYIKLVRTLLQNDSFNKKFNRKYGNNNKRQKAQITLFQADHFSEYYIYIKTQLQNESFAELLNTKIDENTTVSDLITLIESEKTNLLEIVNAYTSLTHFDEMLEECSGKQFTIKPGTKGIESDGDKYFYSSDHDHLKKDWQSSENISSEKYIANMTKLIMHQIRIYDHKDGKYQNRRLDATSYIIASRNLLNDIIYGNITWTNISKDNELKHKNFIETIISLHANPETKLQKILEYLFDTVNGNSVEFYKYINNAKTLTDWDLDVLYSVYHYIFNKKNVNSLISQETSAIIDSNGEVSNLIQEMSGFVDRNTTMDYSVIEYDNETGEIIVKKKKKFFNNVRLYKNRIIMNHYINDNDKLDDVEYKFESQANAQVHRVTLGNTTFTLTVPSDIYGGILSNDDRINLSVYDTNYGEKSKDIFNKLNKIDLLDFKNKILYGTEGNLTSDELILKNILKFLDDSLGLKILANPEFGLSLLEIYKSIYHPVKNKIVGSNYLMPFIQLAMRAKYINHLLNKLKSQNLENEKNRLPELTLKLYLENSNDLLYKIHSENKKSRLFENDFGNVKYRAVSSFDEVLDLWTDAYSMLSGEASKATTKDNQGNSIPNNSVNKLGAMLPYYVEKQKGTNSSSLLLCDNLHLLKGTLHDLEVTSWNQESKSIKDFSAGELFFHSIFNKFWGSYLKDNTVIIQPTTYSDKTTFLQYILSTKFGKNESDIMNSKSYLSDICKLYISTIGEMYKKVWNNTVQKLTNIATVYNEKNGTALNFRQVLNQLTEPQLKMYARMAGEDIMLDKDYRIIKKNGRTFTAVNEELEFYANRLYADEKILSNFLNNEKINFVLNLLDANSIFQVLEFGDKYEYYVDTDGKISDKATSKNPIINVIKSYHRGKNITELLNFFKTWVDEKTGRLIIAKQGNNNIISIGDGFNSNIPVTLNPLLDKFFYVEGFLSNNIRMHLTGSEINHPNKSGNTLYDLVKNAKNVNELKNELKLTNTDFITIQEILNKTLYVGDMNSEFIQLNTGLNEKLQKLLFEIYDKSLMQISNVSQGTLFKRNVIIPATLLYCQQGLRNGIGAQIKCAVIRDEAGHVFNYRGDHEKDIDSADGSAQINPFQSILENRSLGSQAVGFIKKPIWHSYDADSGTSFLAKFATDTITNESMRMSLSSHTNLYKLFKKMTNLLWNGDVDLTESIIQGNISDITDENGNVKKANFAERWFNVAILGNAIKNGRCLNDNKLLYKNQYGEIIEITNFNKTIITNKDTGEHTNIYYTQERVHGSLENSLGIDNSKKVYHLFYDEVDTNTGEIINKSKHITFDTYQQALKFKQENSLNPAIANIRTINSLFELHTALGGINCVDKDGKYSEFSNEVVVNFMNSVGTPKGKISKTDIISLDNYNLPLKKYHIGYALNNTAVKNGAKNINEASAWYDDSELSYFEVDSDGLGMQMNADHDIINSELTEFSQVIAATSAYGYTHDYTNEIFQGLAKAAVLSSKLVITAVDNFLKANTENPEEFAKVLSNLYDIIGRLVMVGDSVKNEENLKALIWSGIKESFYKSKNHANDDVKIPFSDPNVYSDFISTLASTITKNSIKRKHPGSGCVMVPGFNMIQYFEIDDKKLTVDNVLKLAQEDYKNELIDILKQHYGSENKFFVMKNNVKVYFNSLKLKRAEELVNELKLNTSNYQTQGTVTDIIRHYIKTYLEKKQLSAKVYNDKSWFMPTDVVDILNEDGTLLKSYTLDSLDTYYNFTDGIFDTELNYNTKIKVDYKSGSYEISLNEDPKSKITLSKIKEVDGKISDIYKITFLSGTFDESGRRTIDSLPEEQKVRLLRSAISVLPVNSKIRLSSFTSSQVFGGQDIDDYLFFGTLGMTQDSGTYDVSYVDGNGNLLTKTVIEYKKITNLPVKYKYRVNTTLGRNLRPSLIRWQYQSGIDEAENPIIKYNNIFNSPIIKNAYINPNGKPENYRKLIQDELHRIHEEGKFTKDDGTYGTIINGTLENTAAELIVSNMYKDVFGIENESMQEILDKGESYFLSKMKNLNAPVNLLYDLALLKENGNHVLLAFDNVKTGGFTNERAFESTELYTNEKGEIYYTKGNQEVFKVGKWVDCKDVVFDGTNYINTNTNQVLKNSEYRLRDVNDNTSVQRRIDFVKRYQMVSQLTNPNTGKIIYKTNILYLIAKVDEIAKAFPEETNNTKLKNDAGKLRAKIVSDIFTSDNFKIAKVNTHKTLTQNKFDNLNSALGFLLSNYYINEDVKELLLLQLDSLEIVDSKNSSEEAKEERKKLRTINNNNYKNLEKEFLLKQAHKMWISFLDSTNYISSRIPALTLQSFMSMKSIAWTNNNMNMAYVSHFLTYLQGSDYDIDKAYIMGLSYDDNGVYISWSNLFDYTTSETLAASKLLPVPKQIEMLFSENGVDVTAEINQLADYLINKDNEFVLDPKNEYDRLKILQILTKLIRTGENNNGNLNYIGENKEAFNTILDLLNKHEFYKIPHNISEQAYKNVASANIYAVVHDIRNRDQAYTAISMGILSDAADNSPKGNQTKKLNMLNPLTKYLMQYQNIIGKQVIGVAANGEKMWFNAYYYWTKILKSNDPKEIQYLKFLHNFSRIKNRALYNKYKKEGRSIEELQNIIDSETITVLPDLNTRDLIIKEALLREFNLDPETQEYKYVDLLISQLLSAATDNAKELILEKINAGTNFAKMYVYAIMVGFNIDDIVAFMTSPVSEFINSMSAVNIFLNEYATNNATIAISLAKGFISSKKFLHGNMSVYTIDENGEETTVFKNKQYAVKELLDQAIGQYDDNLKQELLRNQLETEDGELEDFKSLNPLMKELILTAVHNDDYNHNSVNPLDLRKLLSDEKDTEVQSYLSYCQDIIEKLREVRKKYDSSQEMINDVEEFTKLFNLATEISSISSAWLGLNQGLPTDKLSIIKKLTKMSKIVYDREKALLIYDNQIFENSKIKDEDSNDDTLDNVIKNSKKGKNIEQNRLELIERIKANNPTVLNIEERLERAHELNIINNFDIIEYLKNVEYREAVKDYYGLIMGTFNVFHMIENIPHYETILECFNSLIVSEQLASKSRMINKLLQLHEGKTLTDSMLKGMINYTEKHNIKNFLTTIPSIILDPSVKGFDRYFNTVTNIDRITFDDLSGIATFKHWVEHEFLDWLRTNPETKNNGAVKHLEIIPDNNNKTLLAMDIDLLNPNITSISREAYNDILQGMAKLDLIDFAPKYKVSDILQLYNLIVNNNRYGEERLTTAFQTCRNPNSIIKLYFNFTAKSDYNLQENLEFDKIDYLIMSAPIISAFRERFATEEIIKVKDPIRGYVIKKRNSKGVYEEYNKMIPPTVFEESNQDRLQRLSNFTKWCSFEMPNSYNIDFAVESINFKSKDLDTMSNTELVDLRKKVLNFLQLFTTSNKLVILKNC